MGKMDRTKILIEINKDAREMRSNMIRYLRKESGKGIVIDRSNKMVGSLFQIVKQATEMWDCDTFQLEQNMVGKQVGRNVIFTEDLQCPICLEDLIKIKDGSVSFYKVPVVRIQCQGEDNPEKWNKAHILCPCCIHQHAAKTSQSIKLPHRGHVCPICKGQYKDPAKKTILTTHVKKGGHVCEK